MKKLYTFISVALLGMAPLFGQTAKDCFKAMPDSLTPLLTEVNKADCIDFLESKMKAEVTNRLGQKSEMTELAPDYIRMQMTSRSWMGTIRRVLCARFPPSTALCPIAMSASIPRSGRNFPPPLSFRCLYWKTFFLFPTL